MKIVVREMLAEAPKAVNLLSRQLGHPLSPEETFEISAIFCKVKCILLL